VQVTNVFSRKYYISLGGYAPLTFNRGFVRQRVLRMLYPRIICRGNYISKVEMRDKQFIQGKIGKAQSSQERLYVVP
jgi:hypothetical protein